MSCPSTISKQKAKPHLKPLFPEIQDLLGFPRLGLSSVSKAQVKNQTKAFVYPTKDKMMLKDDHQKFQ